MSVQLHTGDLLDFIHWNVAAHCANCRNTFGSGLAKQIKDRFLAAYEADTEAFRAVAHLDSDISRTTLLGDFSVGVLDEKRRIVNLYGQADYGRDKR